MTTNNFITVPLSFWFNNPVTSALPIVSLPYKPLRENFDEIDELDKLIKVFYENYIEYYPGKIHIEFEKIEDFQLEPIDKEVPTIYITLSPDEDTIKRNIKKHDDMVNVLKGFNVNNDLINEIMDMLYNYDNTNRIDSIMDILKKSDICDNEEDIIMDYIYDTWFTKYKSRISYENLCELEDLYEEYMDYMNIQTDKLYEGINTEKMKASKYKYSDARRYYKYYDYKGNNDISYEEYNEYKEYIRTNNMSYEMFREKLNLLEHDWHRIDENGNDYGGYYDYPVDSEEFNNAYNLTYEKNCKLLYEIGHHELVLQIIEDYEDTYVIEVRNICDFIYRMHQKLKSYKSYKYMPGSITYNLIKNDYDQLFKCV